MKSNPPPRAQEIELKLALPTSDPATLAKRLAHSPVLARRKPTHQHLHNVYFDTPDQVLNRQRIALRLRRVGSEDQPQWLQTLKTGGQGDSALSQRGEWESPVPGGALLRQALKATPWSAIDPDGSVFKALGPSFATTFERTLWLVRRRDGSVVEVALDIGQIEAGDKTTPICELELELKVGEPAALFEVAQQIAATLAVLPASKSKAERGYALAQDGLDRPQRAQPPALNAKTPLLEAAQRVLREMFCQFTVNLNALRSSDDPEVVHQARVGWRRFKTALRLFRPMLGEPVPSLLALQTLLTCLSELRDLDVALAETLPPIANAYTAGDARREQAWQSMTDGLTQAVDLQRKAVRYALQEPVVGASLLAITQWLEDLTSPQGQGDAMLLPKESLRRWARRRMVRLHEQLQRARQKADKADDPIRLHRVRILAKRLRYGMEALHDLLPKRQRQDWTQQAMKLQMRLGASRDLGQASVLVARLEVDRGLAEFLRGLTLGRNKPQ